MSRYAILIDAENTQRIAADDLVAARAACDAVLAKFTPELAFDPELNATYRAAYEALEVAYQTWAAAHQAYVMAMFDWRKYI